MLKYTCACVAFCAPWCCILAGVVMLKYSELLPHHISMLLVALNAYGNTPFDGKLLKVGAVLCFPAFSVPSTAEPL